MDLIQHAKTVYASAYQVLQAIHLLMVVSHLHVVTIWIVICEKYAYISIQTPKEIQHDSVLRPVPETSAVLTPYVSLITIGLLASVRMVSMATPLI